jgi:hypothetical protein
VPADRRGKDAARYSRTPTLRRLTKMNPAVARHFHQIASIHSFIFPGVKCKHASTLRPVKPTHLVLDTAIALVLAATCACGSSNKGSSSSGASSSGGTGTTTSTSGVGGTGATSTPGCALGAQGLDYAGCPECAACWQQYCCVQSNDCLNDPNCNGILSCQANCYDGQLPDGGSLDPDASMDLADGAVVNVADFCAYTTCLPDDAGAPYNSQQDCISPQCDNPCLCP